MSILGPEFGNFTVSSVIGSWKDTKNLVRYGPFHDAHSQQLSLSGMPKTQILSDMATILRCTGRSVFRPKHAGCFAHCPEQRAVVKQLPVNIFTPPVVPPTVQSGSGSVYYLGQPNRPLFVANNNNER